MKEIINIEKMTFVLYIYVFEYMKHSVITKKDNNSKGEG